MYESCIFFSTHVVMHLDHIKTGVLGWVIRRVHALAHDDHRIEAISHLNRYSITWCQTCDKPWPEPTVNNTLTLIYITSMASRILSEILMVDADHTLMSEDLVCVIYVQVVVCSIMLYLTIYIVYPIVDSLYVNPLRAKFFWGNINIYLHFVSFLHIDLAQVLKTLPQGREGCKEPEHQQPWYWPS